VGEVAGFEVIALGDDVEVAGVDAERGPAGVVKLVAGLSGGQAGVVEPFPDEAVCLVDAIEAWVPGLAVAEGVFGAMPGPAGIRVVGDRESHGSFIGAGSDECVHDAI
jgi:hypothetical protein